MRDITGKKVLAILKKTKAVITNDHFVYTSGKHGSVYINKDAVYPHTQEVSRIGKLFAQKFKNLNIDLVAAPALGGIVLSQWTAFHLSKLKKKEVLGVYTEKTLEKNQIFTRGYDKLVRGKNVLVIEDLTTTGGSVKKVINSVLEHGGKVKAVGVMVNRDPRLVNKDSIGFPFFALSILYAESFDEKDCPMCEKKIPINTSVGHGKKYLETLKAKAKPFYDPLLSYEENYDEGPFSEFGNDIAFQQKGEPRFDFLGQKVYLPFGIAAGPLLNSKFVKAAFEKGFDLCVYKTVRSNAFPCHAFPNVLSIDIDGDATFDKLAKPLIANTEYKDPISITNSFGVPSQKPEIWQEDVKKAISYAKKGQVLVLSFMGTVKKDQTQKEFIDDFVMAAKLAYETGAKILEANLSCPNIGNEGLVCYNLEVTEKIAREIRKVIHNTPFILKVGYYKDDNDMEKLADIANEYVDGIAGINTLQAAILDENGSQALPGPNRLRSGICGNAIKWAGLDFVKRLKKVKDKKKYKFHITGIGGVLKPEDYTEYVHMGADSVMCATGAMWNPYLAKEIKEFIG